MLLNPTGAKSAAYNPLWRCGAYEVREVQNIADILVDPDGALERRNPWEKTAHRVQATRAAAARAVMAVRTAHIASNAALNTKVLW